MSKRWNFSAAALLLCALAAPVGAASDLALQKYAEAVDLLDRWRGDRQVLDAAHDRLTELLLEAPEFAPAHVELARWYLMNSHNNESALKALARAEVLEPGFAGTYVLRGYVLHKQGRNQEALAELDRAEAIGTDNPWLQLNRGLALQELGRQDEALPLFQKVFDVNHEDPKAWPSAKLELLDHYGRMGDSEGIERVHLRSMELKSADPAQVLEYAGWLSEVGRHDDAIAALRTRSGAPRGQELEMSVLQLMSAKALQLQVRSAGSDEARAAYAEMSAQAQGLGIGPLPSFEDWAAQALEYSRLQMP
jgi:tetratricopeptide (TPR) repeat protein